MAITSEDFNYIRNLVRNHSAIVIDTSKEYLVESRLHPLARQEGFASLRHMVDHLQSGGSLELRRKVVEAMTTNETSFFREIRVFEMLRTSIMPRLLAARERERSFNFWCAAASTGQEPYSFAMVLREHFPSIEGRSMTFIASDISREMLARARAGRYNQLEVNRGLPAHLLVKYFQKKDEVWEINPEIRNMVDFREINLIHEWPFLPRMDIIFMRNVLIYMDLDTKTKILSGIKSVLNPDGYVLLGGGETTSNIDDAFEPVAIAGATCFRFKSRAQVALPAGVPGNR